MRRRKKKSGHEDETLKIIVFVTALLNLAKALIDIISRLSE